MAKSNCTLFEWLQSPINYGEYISFKNDFHPLLAYSPNLRGHVCHYLGLFQSKFNTLSSSAIRLKYFFYMIRSLLSAQWIITYNSYAPMQIRELMVLLPSDLVEQLESMIKLKSSVNEDFQILIEKEWLIYMEEVAIKLKESIATLPTQKISEQLLDHYFLKLFEEKEYDN